MILLHAAPVIWERIGGLQASIPGLITALGHRDDVETALLTTVANRQPTPEHLEFPVFSGPVHADRYGRLNLDKPFDRPDLVVFHSTYIPAHARLAEQLTKADIPYVLCPRGGMTRRSLASKRWKKRVGNLLFFNWVVDHAEALHYLTEGEARGSEHWHRPHFIAGNGVQLPDPSALASPGIRDGLQLLFIGRMHIDHKGLDVLLHAAALVREQLTRAGVRLELHGPDHDGSHRTLARQIDHLGLDSIVSLHGPVQGSAKTDLLRRADVFVHPSRTEGHPSAVLEALAHGVPCMLTPQTNIADLTVAAGAGWRVEPSAQGIADGLRRIIAMDRPMLHTAGINARALAADSFDWSRIAEQCMANYQRFAA